MDYVTEKRMKLASKMLLEGAYSVHEIAEKCGFSDSGFFSKVFLKEVGMTPSDFRKNSFEIWNTELTFKINRIKVGQYVEYDVSYTDIYQGTSYTSTNGWRYLGTDNEGNG